MRLGPFKRSFGPIPIGFKRVQTILQNVVHFGHAVFDQPIEALEFIVGVRDLSLERRDVPVYGGRLSERTP